MYKLKKQYRLPCYEYSSNGYYFVTICTKKRKHIFGRILNEKMRFSAIGKIAKQYWENIPDHYFYAKIDTFTVMPNHIHGILIINHKTHPNACTNGGNTVLGGNTVPGGNTVDDLLPNDPFRDGQLTVPTGMKSNLQPSPNSLSIVIRNYKAAVTTWVRKHYLVQYVWQSRFYDRIIHNDEELERIREYINGNPAQWAPDRNNLSNLLM